MIRNAEAKEILEEIEDLEVKEEEILVMVGTGEVLHVKGIQEGIPGEEAGDILEAVEAVLPVVGKADIQGEETGILVIIEEALAGIHPEEMITEGIQEEEVSQGIEIKEVPGPMKGPPEDSVLVSIEINS